MLDTGAERFDSQAPFFDRRTGLPDGVAAAVAREVVQRGSGSVLEIGAGTGQIIKWDGAMWVTLGDGFNSKWGTGNGFFNGDYNGRLLAIARFAIPVLPKLTAHLVGAYDRAAEANINGDHQRGFEFDLWAQWDILPKLWLRIGGGYYVTGEWWENNPDASFDGTGAGVSDPDNLWQFGTRLQYDFG